RAGARRRAGAVDRRRGPLSDAVDGDDRGALERRREERRSRVGEVVVGEEELIELAPERGADLALHPEPLAEPRRERARELRQARQELAEVGREDPLELPERLLVEDDVVDVRHRQPRLLEAEPRRLDRERGVVLDAAEALLLGGRDDLSV